MKTDANEIHRTHGVEALKEAWKHAENPFDCPKANESAGPPTGGSLLVVPPWWRDPATIPPRDFLYGKHFSRKNIGASIGAGGRLKTTFSLFESIEATVGRNLTTGDALPKGPIRTLVLNAEEDQDELDRRLAAICQFYQITEHDLGGRLFVKSVRGSPLRFATMQRMAPILNTQTLEKLEKFIAQKNIDLFMVDPWVSFHAVRENENTDMDLVIKEGLGGIAERTNSAGEIFHHPGKPKPGQAETTVEDARGASALIWAARSARVFNFMTPDEAAKLGIGETERRRYVRIANGKANNGPVGTADWIKIDVENLPNGDQVAFPSRWTPPNAFDGITTDNLLTGERLAATGGYRADSRSPDWYGYALAESLSIPVVYGADNDPKHLARLNAIIKTWVKNKVLKVETRKDAQFKERKFIVRGKASIQTNGADHGDDEF